jgi:outer membrane protein assembly factor BamB
VVLRKDPRVSLAALALVVAPVALAASGCRCDAPGGPGAVVGSTGAPASASASSASNGASSASASGSASGASASGSASASASPCGTSPWLTYNHDAGRTGASDGCCRGPLRALWTARPRGLGKERPGVFYHAVADEGGVYVAGVIGQSPSLERLSAGGDPVWTFDSRVDYSQAPWPTLAPALGRVVLNDDGFFVLDPASGERVAKRGLDYWGQTASDGARIYYGNVAHIDGPGLFVGAADREGAALWQRNRVGSIPRDVTDGVGAIALEGGRLVHATRVRGGGQAGLYTFDAATGTPGWSAPVVPLGDVSARDGRLYSSEQSASGPALVARDVETGTTLWSAPLRPGPTRRAPVLTGGLVVVTEREGVRALDANGGQERWRVDLNLGLQDAPPAATAVAAAEGSQTLVVTTATEGVLVLAARDGSRLWQGKVGPSTAAPHSPVLVGSRAYAVANGSLVALGCEGAAP